METTERIVEAYLRYVKHCATVPNIRCAGQYEIDLLAINPLTLDRYHVESTVSISHVYSRLTDKPFSLAALKQRTQTAGQRRTIGYFVERKFGQPEVLETLAGCGFVDGGYAKVVVAWGWTDCAAAAADKHGIVLWDFRDLMRQTVAAVRDTRQYFTDDTMRTLHLFDRVQRETAGLAPAVDLAAPSAD